MIVRSLLGVRSLGRPLSKIHLAAPHGVSACANELRNLVRVSKQLIYSHGSSTRRQSTLTALLRLQSAALNASREWNEREAVFPRQEQDVAGCGRRLPGPDKP